MVRNIKKPRGIVWFLLLLSIGCALIAQALPWGEVNANTKVGNISVSLKLDLYEHGVNYRASGRGKVGLPSVGKEVNIRRTRSKTFLTGLKDFQEDIGFIFDSYKEDYYKITPKTENCKDTVVVVKTKVDQIPWWTAGWEEDVYVEVKLSKRGRNFSKVGINKVRIELWANWNDTKKCYTEPIGGWRITPEDYLYDVGDSKTYNKKVVLGKEYDRVGLAGTAEITLFDKSNGTDTPLAPQISPAQMRINIRTISQLQTLSILLMVGAFPITLLGVALSSIAIYFVYRGKIISTKFMLLGGIFHVVALICYINGINTLIDLVGFVKPWFDWTFMLAFPILSAALLFAGFIVLRKFKLRGERELVKE